VGIPVAGIPRFPGAGSSARGQPAPKARPRGAADGEQANIPALEGRVSTDAERAEEGGAGRGSARSARGGRGAVKHAPRQAPPGGEGAREGPRSPRTRRM
jgi:hypothetical protein